MRPSPEQICNYRWITWSGIRDAFALYDFRLSTSYLGTTRLHTKISTFEGVQEFTSLCYGIERPNSGKILELSALDPSLQMLLPLVPIDGCAQGMKENKRYPYVYLMMYHPDFTLEQFKYNVHYRCAKQGPPLAHPWPRQIMIDPQEILDYCARYKTLHEVSKYILHSVQGSSMGRPVKYPVKIKDLLRRVMRAWKQRREDEREDISTRAIIRRQGWHQVRYPKGEMFIMWTSMVREISSVYRKVYDIPIMRHTYVRYAFMRRPIGESKMTWNEIKQNNITTTIGVPYQLNIPWLRDHLLDVKLDTRNAKSEELFCMKVSIAAHQILRENKATGKRGEFWPQFFDYLSRQIQSSKNTQTLPLSKATPFEFLTTYAVLFPSTCDDPWLFINHTDPWIEQYSDELKCLYLMPYLDQILLDRFHAPLLLGWLNKIPKTNPRARFEIGSPHLRNIDSSIIMEYFDYSLAAWRTYGSLNHIKKFVKYTKVSLCVLSKYEELRPYLYLHRDATDELMAKLDLSIPRNYRRKFPKTKNDILRLKDSLLDLRGGSTFLNCDDMVNERYKFIESILRIAADEFGLILERDLDSDRNRYLMAEDMMILMREIRSKD